MTRVSEQSFLFSLPYTPHAFALSPPFEVPELTRLSPLRLAGYRLLYPLPGDFLDVTSWPRFLVALLEMAKAHQPNWVGRILYEMAVQSWPSFKLLREWSTPPIKGGETMVRYDWCPVLDHNDRK